jgi:hypothetical protein
VDPGAKPHTGGRSIEDTMRADGMNRTAVMTMADAGAKTRGTEFAHLVLLPDSVNMKYRFIQFA